MQKKSTAAKVQLPLEIREHLSKMLVGAVHCHQWTAFLVMPTFHDQVLCSFSNDVVLTFKNIKIKTETLLIIRMEILSFF